MRASVALLSYEHGVIRQVLDVLGETLKRGIAGRSERHVAEMVGFLDRYVDKSHHKKEERFVFPSAVRNTPSLDSSVEDLIKDHRRVARLLSALASEIKGGSIAGSKRFSDKGRSLAELLTQHIQKEENFVFPRIEEALTIEEDADVYSKCEEYVFKKFGPNFLREAEEFSFRIQDEVLGPGYYQGIA